MANLNELHYFAVVAHSKSFTVAAKRLKVPKSSVSRAISRLERRLNIQLIQRTTRSVRLTEAGMVYLKHCQRVVEEADLADIAIGAMMATPRGLLRIGAPISFVRHVLEPLMNEFLPTFPELQVHIMQLESKERHSDEIYDLVIRAGPLEDSSWIVKPLMRFRSGIYANPGLFKRRRRPDTPDELERYSCVETDCGERDETGVRAVWRLHCDDQVRDIEVPVRVAVPDPFVRHRLALEGFGIARLGQAAAALDVKEGRLIRVLPQWEPEPFELFALHPARAGASPKLRVFLDFLAKHCNDEFNSEGVATD